MRKVKIPWIVYAVIGGLVVYLVRRLNDPKFVFFEYLGYIFLAVAVFKLLAYFMTRRGSKKEIRQAMGGLKAPEPPKHRCRYCGAPVFAQARFCYSCGARVRN